MANRISIPFLGLATVKSSGEVPRPLPLPLPQPWAAFSNRLSARFAVAKKSLGKSTQLTLFSFDLCNLFN